MEKVASYIHSPVYNRWLGRSCYITQGAQPGALDDLEEWDGEEGGLSV